MTCTDGEAMFSIRKNNMNYTRSYIFGGGDSINVAYGICEKF